jgi:preprotein translocase subunit SecE
VLNDARMMGAYARSVVEEMRKVTGRAA